MGGGSFSGFPQGMPGGLSINPVYAQQGGGLPPILSPQLMQQQQLVQLQLQQQTTTTTKEFIRTIFTSRSTSRSPSRGQTRQWYSSGKQEESI